MFAIAAKLILLIFLYFAKLCTFVTFKKLKK